MKPENQKSPHISKTPKIISILIKESYIGNLAGDTKGAKQWLPLLLPVPSQPPPHQLCTPRFGLCPEKF